MKVGALVLAAGTSSRMGRQKLLANWCGQPLLWHAVKAAMGSCAETFVMVGADADRVASACAPGTHIIPVTDFEEGMAASLRAGVAAARMRAWDGALVFLGDMPAIGDNLPARMIAAFENVDDVVAPEHGGRRGNPILWGRHWFESLDALRGEQGGRNILAQHSIDLKLVPAKSDAIFLDIDTEEALAKLREAPPAAA